MNEVHPSSLPDKSLLSRYVSDANFTDCYYADVPFDVSHEQYVCAFYTTWLFKLERFILRWVVSRPSTDEQAMALAAGQIREFAAWSVEDKTTNQLLMCDLGDRTRSWLMVDSAAAAGSSCTRLYFGSAVVAAVNERTGEKNLGTVFRLLLRFHKRYSVALLSTAVSSLRKTNGH